MNKLSNLHKRCARFISRGHLQMLEDNTWSYPNSKDALESAGLLTTGEYIEDRKSTVTIYAQSTQIFTKCMNSKPSPRDSSQIVWWKYTKTQENGSEENE
jgi:hypothetical protein